MASRGLCVFLLLAVLAGAAPAAAPPTTERAPDELLPATTQVYVRWDGVQAHRDAYRRSAIGELLGGEMGQSVRAVWRRFGDDLKLRAVADKLLDGVPPEELRRRDELVKAVLVLPPVLAQTGVVAGFEARIIPPVSAMIGRLARLASGKSEGMDAVLPHVQFTAVFPGAMKHPAVVTFLDKLAAFGEKDGVQQATIAGRKCRVMKGEAGGWGWAWWMEGTHLVVVGALGDPVPAVANVPKSGKGVTGQTLYQSLKTPTGFETTARGFIDVKSILATVRRFVPSMTLAAIEDAGLFDVEAVRFREGFEGDASRAVWEVDFNARQRGISRVLIKKAINLKDLPPLPADAMRWTAGRANLAVLYDLLLTFVAARDPDATKASGSAAATKALAEAKKQARKEIADALGGNDVEDVLGSLGDVFVTHCAMSDGLSSLGQVVAVSVKDERKLNRALEPLMRKLAKQLGEQVRFRKRSFHGVAIREIVPDGRSPVSLACTVYKGWLVLAVNPQAIQGFILRSNGKLDMWKPDSRTARALARIPADAGLVQVVDPRSTVQFLLSVAPTVVGLFPRREAARNFIDPGDLPHAGAVTRHLFPNVSWTSFDGKTFRIESRESLWMPLQEIGPEWLFYLSAF